MCVERERERERGERERERGRERERNNVKCLIHSSIRGFRNKAKRTTDGSTEIKDWGIFSAVAVFMTTRTYGQGEKGQQ